MAGAGSTRDNLIKESKFAGLVVNGEGADAAGFFPLVIVDFIDRVKDSAVGVDGKKGGVHSLSSHAERDKLSCGFFKAIRIDAHVYNIFIGRPILVGGKSLNWRIQGA